MSKAQKKLIDILEKMKVKVFYSYALGEKMSGTKEMVVVLDSLLAILKKQNKSLVFTEFDYLCKLLELVDFSAKEKFDIIFHFLKSNLDTGFLNCKEVIYSNEEDFVEHRNICIAHRVLKNSYFDKKDCYSEKDIKKIYLSLSLLGIDKDNCNLMNIILTSKYKKRLSQSSFKINKEEKKDVKTITKQEEHDIWIQLGEYYDFKRNKPKRKISEKEKMKCILLLRKVGSSDKVIYSFLKDVENYSLRLKNPITRYLESREKLQYYEEKYGLQEYIKSLDSYFKEIFICDNNDYIFWKSSINQELEKAYSYLPRSFDYEFSKIKD